jgi:hypothetical protein
MPTEEGASGVEAPCRAEGTCKGRASQIALYARSWRLGVTGAPCDARRALWRRIFEGEGKVVVGSHPRGSLLNAAIV